MTFLAIIDALVGDVIVPGSTDSGQNRRRNAIRSPEKSANR